MQHRSAHIALIVSLVLAAALTIGVGRADAFSAALGFAAHADFTTGNYPYSVAVGDFNGDGNVDLVTTNLNDVTASVHLGDGSGGFAARSDFAVGTGPVSAAVGDFNGDGNQDLVTANYNASTTSILLGDGSGGFAAKTDFATGASPYSVAVGDFNGDGKLDLVTANRVASVSVLLGNGSGGFAAHADFATSTWSSSVAVGDFNGDGKLDLAVVNYYDNAVSVLLGNGSGGFAAKTDFPASSLATAVAVGDFNGDGHQDLVTIGNYNSFSSVLLGHGDGTFAAKTNYATANNPYSVAVGDFNGDGKQDLAVATSADAVSVLLSNGSGGFAAKKDFATGANPYSVAVGDFNGDGMPDLATANRNANTAGVLLNMTLSGTMVIEGDAAATAGALVRIDSPAANAVQMRLRDQGGVWGLWQPYAAQIYWMLPAGDGPKTIETQYRNSLGQTPIVSDSILLDTSAPTTTDDAPIGWQGSSPATVTLTPDDGAGSGMSGGLAKTQYKLDGAASWTIGTSVPVGGEGTHTIAYRSIDAVGNVGDIESCTVKIDTAAPTTAVRGLTGVWQNWPQTIFLTAADTGSGMSGGSAQTEYDLDGVGWTSGDWVVVATDGDHTLSVRSTDAVGNREEAQKMEVLVDRTPPVTTDNSDGLPHQVFSLVLTPADATSGVAATSYRIDGGGWVSGTSVTLRVAIRHKRGGYGRGDHLIEYRSTDNAGNVEVIEHCTVTLGW